MKCTLSSFFYQGLFHLCLVCLIRRWVLSDKKESRREAMHGVLELGCFYQTAIVWSSIKNYLPKEMRSLSRIWWVHPWTGYTNLFDIKFSWLFHVCGPSFFISTDIQNQVHNTVALNVKVLTLKSCQIPTSF